MRIKRKNGLKVAAITIALLLCLALAIGITGAFYQAKRQATGTLSMDQGIIIDYKGFGKTPDEGIWTRETTTTFLLFDETNAQPGEEITVNAAGIRANEKSVNFYARVKLSYKFYNVVKSATEGEQDTENVVYDSNATTGNVEGFKPSDLITTSANFFGINWVESGDGYYYYGSGTTLNKFNKGTQTFVNLFATDAKFVIEGAGFTGATSNGEGGGFVVGDTSINKIEVYLTLETLQGDADAAAEGWKISSQVDFAKVDEGKIVTSVNGDPVNEKLNVTINGNESKLEEVKFPYGEETILEFDSKNVEYVELTYSDGTKSDRFYELEASENSATKYSQIQVKANENKKVTGYIIGTFSDSEYKGFGYSTTRFGYNDEEEFISYEISNGVLLTGYFGDDTVLTIPSKVKVRTRDFKVKVEGYTKYESFCEKVDIDKFQFPCKANNEYTIQSAEDFEGWLLDTVGGLTEEEFSQEFKECIITYTNLCETSSILYGYKNVIAVRAFAFRDNRKITEVTISEGVTSLDEECFSGCRNLDVVNIKGNKLETMKQLALRDTKLTKLVIDSITPPDISNWQIDSNENTKVYVPAAYLEAYKTAWGITEDGILGTF